MRLDSRMSVDTAPVTVVAHDYLTQRGGAERVALEIVCSTSGWAHGLRATERTTKVVYCHNPARWLYQREDYVRDQSKPVQAVLGALSPRLRAWDKRAARTADVCLANSVSVAERIERVYGIHAEVLHPPLSIDVNGKSDPVDGLPDEFFLSVSRARGYKGTALLIDAFARMPEQTLVVVGVDHSPSMPANVIALGTNVPEERLRWLYAHTRALMSMSHEDFGLTPVEANAFGRPALVLRAGGFLDSTLEGVSGLFIDEETPDAIVAAVRAFPAVDQWDAAAIRAAADRFSPTSFARNLRDVVAGARAR